MDGRGATHCKLRNYNAHAVDNGNTQNEAQNINKIPAKLAGYTVFKGLIGAGWHRSKWFNAQAHDKMRTFFIGINHVAHSMSVDF